MSELKCPDCKSDNIRLLGGSYKDFSQEVNCDNCEWYGNSEECKDE